MPVIEIEKLPNKSLVEGIEDLLEQAKAGQVMGLIYAVSLDDGDSSHGWRLGGLPRKEKVRLYGELGLLRAELELQFSRSDGGIINEIEGH